MINWCNKHVGYERMYHPKHEAINGYIDIDTFKGDWAVDRVEHNFWFADGSNLTAFMLQFSGHESVEIRRL